MTSLEHNKWLGIAHLSYAGFQLLMMAVTMAFIGVMFSNIFGQARRMGGEPPPPFVGLVLVLAGVFQVVFSIPPIVAGFALLKRRSWAKIAAIVGGVVAAMSFPIGTALAVYTFWFLFSDPGQQLYPSKSSDAPPPPPDDWQAAGSDQSRGPSMRQE
jgi:hypothetical protein